MDILQSNTQHRLIPPERETKIQTPRELTHFLAQHPRFRFRVHFHKNGWRADEQHQEIGNAQVG